MKEEKKTKKDRELEAELWALVRDILARFVDAAEEVRTVDPGSGAALRRFAREWVEKRGEVGGNVKT